MNVLVLLLTCFISKIAGWCKPSSNTHCENWSSCSQSCGGGSRSRECYSCVWYQKRRQHESCNEICLNGYPYSSGSCRCSSWRTGTCCEACRHIHIPHCVSGSQSCGGSPDGIKCTHCVDPYYSDGYNRGCKECPAIDHCISRHCTNPSNRKCIQCKNNRVLFQLSPDHTACDRMCSFDNDYCWPGTCGSGITKNCRCASGFTPIANSAETSCQPNIPPDIETCNTVFTGPNGEKNRAKSASKSSICGDLQDMYGSYHPVNVTFDMVSSYVLNISNIARPSFIVEENFGLTDTTVYIEKMSLHGSKVRISSHPQLLDSSSSTSVKGSFPSKANIALNQVMSNGEALCVVYEALGGGYLKSKNVLSSDAISAPIPYRKIKQTEQVCYRYDSSKPEHCVEKGSCKNEPLTVSHIITRSSVNTVLFEGWFDPIPTGGQEIHASKINSYEIRVNEVIPSKAPLKVDYTNVLFTNKTAANVHDMTLNLTSNTPRLYCITLEVTDNAKNPRQARRFMLYDNTTYIEIRNDKPFRITSASSQTKSMWQTHHHDICLSWTDHFLNRFYLENELLHAIEPDPNGLIQGVYEQTHAPLSVKGTPNVHGITSFMISWSLNEEAMSKEIAVPNFLNQSFCHDMAVKDGQLYTIQIRPIDVVGNSLAENRTVRIDRSVPHLNNIWLTKDGYPTLFVHHSRDLSSMQLTFEAIDPHSGISSVQYAFGVSDASDDLTTGMLKVETLSNSSCPDGVKCYCPDIGLCEIFNYSIPLNKLVAAQKHEGNHNRNYFFTIKVTNNAMLSNTEHIDILVDDSPPEVGMVYEGPETSADIDYISDDSFIVHWKGFIDHESGIKAYRIGLTDRCLGQKELYNFTDIDDIEFYEEVPFTETSTRVPANFTGKRVITVVALNNAMSPSKPVCSDGIIRDTSPPDLKNLTIEHASWQESIACHEGKPWFLESSLTKVMLQNNSFCEQKCTVPTDNDALIDGLPSRYDEVRDKDVDEFLCRNMPMYDNKTIIYIPNSRIYLQWDIDEKGSQILDYFVGFGTHPSEVSSPSISDYKSTNKKLSYQHRHIGVGSNEIFHIFVKVVNKAGLERVYDVGPVLVDETPPLHNYIPAVTVVDDQITVGWENDTFYDMEQTEQISSIFFQIGHNDVPTTPLLQWHLFSSEHCPDFTGGCFRYPLRRLQVQDTDDGLYFYVDMYVYNKAGHSLTVRTKSFQIPSSYPPGHAVVRDIDPNLPDDYIDVDFHFTANTICAYWHGFEHHQGVDIQMGIGTNHTSDNVVPFSQVNSTEFHCIFSAYIENDRKYYALVKATCTGGTTISNSNGIIIHDEKSSISSLSVWPGMECFKRGGISVRGQIVKTSENTTDGAAFLFNAVVGKRYDVKINNGSLLNFYSNDGIFEILTYTKDESASFVSFVEQPRIFTNQSEIIKDQIHIALCPSTFSIRKESTLSTYWKHMVDGFNGLNYKVAITHSLSNSNVSQILQYVTPFQDVPDGRQHFTFRHVNLKAGNEYRVAVRLCSVARCTNQTLSEIFRIEHIPSLTVLSAALAPNTSTCSMIDVKWNVSAIDNTALFYQWTISRDEMANKLITKWRTVHKHSSLQVSNGFVRLDKAASCIEIPVHLHSTMYACVRGFTEAGNAMLDCRTLLYQSPNYDVNTVYDFDSNKQSWSLFKQVLSSTNIGEIYKILHDDELDFGTRNSSVVGAMLYAEERSVTWYLMHKRHVPLDCDTDNECVISIATDDGYVHIPNDFIISGKVYYICAKANTTTATRELFEETLAEIQSCSNGFVLDNSPPVGGEVNVKNSNGFLTNTKVMETSWDRFVDNVHATQLGYTDDIKGYSLAIGSQPYRDDIQKLRGVGLNRNIVIDVDNVSDGSIIYVFVKGFNHAGLYDVVSSPEVVVDTSPPTLGEIYIDTGHGIYKDLQKDYLTSSEMIIHLIGFGDKHSGLSHYRIGIGSRSYVADIVPLFDCIDDMTALNLDNTRIIDGHDYFLLVQVVNRAGLESQFQTKSFRVDRTPPSGGHVLDGPSIAKKDVDFQSDLNAIHCHWKAFMDVHSGLAYYKVGLGTEPYNDNIVSMVDVGLSKEKYWHGTFDVGQKYYILVEACNTAGMCTRRSSDGVTLDNSPPIQGLVRVGASDKHQKFLPHTSVAHVHWVGFNDPHSGIEKYKMCIGTQPGQCDTLPLIDCLLRSNIIKTGLNLPVNTDLFATVIAVNKAGLSISQTSDSFRIDETAPKLVRKPYFIISNDKHENDTQWEKSILTIEWEFSDDDSPIVMHELSLKTHHEGHTPVENIKVGAENRLAINLDGEKWLHNGDKYIAVVTCCNMAGLCIASETDDLLIDSTPPHAGGFMPPLLWRHLTGPDKTLKSEIALTWYGFYDHESEIEKYFIAVSRFYSGDELSHGIFTVNADTTKHKQNATITLSENILPDDQIVLTIWATNNVGLNSSLARISVNAIQAIVSKSVDHSNIRGILEIEKHSCDIHFCNKDCTCAVFGKPCVHMGANTTCQALNVSDNTLSLPNVAVHVGLHGQHANITSSSACLTGSWISTSIGNSTQSVLRYEWSMGLFNQSIGEGIFDLKTEIPWKDVGLRNEIVYCLPVNKSLTHGAEYVVYTRAWFSANTYATYQSEPVMVDQSAPSIRRGRNVIDSDSTCSYDLDVINWNDTITACWQGVFSELQGRIVYYTLKMGTSGNADDILPLTNVGLATRYTLTNLSLSQDTFYFFTVMAYNNAGLHKSTTSDGFVTDIDAPISGTVYNSIDYRNRDCLSSTESMAISFQGFQDDSSGIRYLLAAITNTTELTSITIPFTNVGMRTQHTFSNLNLQHGQIYYAAVKAVDNAGHWSDVAMSKGTLIDTTSPIGIACNTFHTLLYESTKTVDVAGMSVLINANLSEGTLYAFNGRFSAVNFEARVKIHIENYVLVLPVSLLHDGSFGFEYRFIPLTNVNEIVVHLLGRNVTNTIVDLQTCDEVTEDEDAAVTVRQVSPSTIAVNVAVVDEESDINKVEVGAGTTPGGFQVQPLTPIHNQYISSLIHSTVPHGSSLHVTIVAENRAGLRSVFHSKPLVVDHTPPIIKGLTVLQNQNTTDEGNDTVTYTVLGAQWEAEDDESDIKYCFCSIGSEPSLSNVQSHRTAQTKKSCSSDALYLNHGQNIIVSVRCVNFVQLAATVSSEPVYISLQSSETKSAKVDVIPLNVMSSKYTSAVTNTISIQSNRSCVELKWGGFHDPTGIDYYEYRIVYNEHTVVDWTRENRRHMTMDCHQKMNDGRYKAEVRAINGGQHVSNSVSTWFMVVGDEPKLTGRPISMTKIGRNLAMDWHNVFSTMSGVPISFDVTVGTKSDFNDIEDLRYTSGYGLNISVPTSTLITPHVQEVFVRLECMYATGEFAIYRSTYKL